MQVEGAVRYDVMPKPSRYLYTVVTSPGATAVSAYERSPCDLRYRPPHWSTLPRVDSSIILEHTPIHPIDSDPFADGYMVGWQGNVWAIVIVG